mmetsp:Transcript_10370/g.34044  ORF Transcript_10370/g.34044 Transcript_10370/m.34044 type:complete len:205 (-) Transcript_10370:528-1142(-)
MRCSACECAKSISPGWSVAATARSSAAVKNPSLFASSSANFTFAFGSGAPHSTSSSCSSHAYSLSSYHSPVSNSCSLSFPSPSSSRSRTSSSRRCIIRPSFPESSGLRKAWNSSRLSKPSPLSSARPNESFAERTHDASGQSQSSGSRFFTAPSPPSSSLCSAPSTDASTSLRYSLREMSPSELASVMAISRSVRLKLVLRPTE